MKRSPARRSEEARAQQPGPSAANGRDCPVTKQEKRPLHYTSFPRGSELSVDECLPTAGTRLHTSREWGLRRCGGSPPTRPHPTGARLLSGPQVRSRLLSAGPGTCIANNDLFKVMGWGGLPDSSVGEKSACIAGDPGSVPRFGRSPGEGKGSPLQYSGLENSMDHMGLQGVRHD